MKVFNYVRFKSLKDLVKEKKIEILDYSDDGETITFKVLPTGPIIRHYYGDDKLLIVDCDTIHKNLVEAYPWMFEEA